MARKSRKTIHNTVTSAPAVRRFKTAIYARLSAENSGKDDNQDAIKNQVAVCREFILQNSELVLTDTYVDNGQKGTSFDRPQFNRLMEDIKSGKIECLVVRDLSRFGRDYIETGTYLERVFPSIGLRFISVNEHYDSFTNDGTNEDLMIPLQNMINGIYAKDISRKTFSSHRTRFLSGEFKRNILPYGYYLDETRFKILIDQEAARFVRLIFQWKIEGKSIKSIISSLEEMQAPNARVRKAKTGVQTGDVSSYSGWHYSTVRNILKNHMYIGQTVIGKKVRSLFKGVICEEIKDPNKWIVLDNTHDAIIAKDAFEKVQEIMAAASEKKKKSMAKTEEKRRSLVDLFKGKIFCADCGTTMTFIRIVDGNNCNASYKCTLYSRKKECSIHSINHKLLYEKVLTAIQMQVMVALDYEKLLFKLRDSESERSIRDKQNANIRSLNLRLNGIQRKRAKLYKDFSCNLLDTEEYNFANQSYQDEAKRLGMLREEAILRKAEFDQALSSENKWITLMKSVSTAKELSQGLVDQCVERVIVHENGDIELVMKYADIYAFTVASVREVCEVA